MKKLLPLFLFVISFSVFAQTKINKDERIIRKNIGAFSQALMNGEFEKVVQSYTEDAKIFPRNMDILHGHDAIRKYWTPPTDANYKTIYHKISPEEIKIVGDEAYDWGYYEGKTKYKDSGKVSEWKGKYVITWKKQENGEWKIYLDIWNSIPIE